MRFWVTSAWIPLRPAEVLAEVQWKTEWITEEGADEHYL